LWWVCVRERNRLSTERHERKKAEAGYGDYESEEREAEVGWSAYVEQQVV
jgi:large subunit ribosomal protein L47